MHKRIVETVLARLDEEKAGYFNAIVSRLEEDPRIERFPNIIFLVLKETMELVPAYLDKGEFIDALIDFCKANLSGLRGKIYNKEFVYDSACMREITGQFVNIIVDLTLQKHQQGEIDGGDPSVQRYTWPYRASDLIDPDDVEGGDEDAEAPEPPPYTGPERRKSGKK